MTKNDKYILTAESVTEGHPDKLCDTIADRVLDACLERDLDSRVACEVLATAGKILVAGEITTKTLPDIFHIVCKTVQEVGYGGDYEVEVIIHDQSPDIAWAVDGGAKMGAGDQGIVYGYACRETREYLPLPVVLAHRITKGLTQARKTGQIPGLRPDGKAQVSIEYENGQPQRVAAVVVSCQHEEDVDLESLREEIHDKVLKAAFWDFPLDKETRVFLNPGGVFHLGGFEADTGLTGRKLMVDTYKGTKESFDFLGFTHYNAKSHWGKYCVLHRTSKKKLKQKRQRAKEWLREHMHESIPVTIELLNKKLIGHYRYYGIYGNWISLKKFYSYVKYELWKVKRRRDQSRWLTWEKFKKILRIHPLAWPKVYLTSAY